MFSCPLCRSLEARYVRCIEVEPLIILWQEHYKIDVRQEFRGFSKIELWQCSKCDLSFFMPDSLAGSSKLYSELEKFDWYYMRRKWEHDVAIKDMGYCKNGIEIGCGLGDFVARVVREKQIPFEGSEQNSTAAAVGREKGLVIHLENIEDLAAARPASYDVICSFQVLEHVMRPKSFLEAACSLLRPGGSLMLGLPNAASFLRHQFNLLDLPPHHMTRWTKSVLVSLQRLFPLRIERLAYEPLADYHVIGFVEAYTSVLCKAGLRIFSHPGIRSRVAAAISSLGVQRLLTGQTLYVHYVRT